MMVARILTDKKKEDIINFTVNYILFFPLFFSSSSTIKYWLSFNEGRWGASPSNRIVTESANSRCTDFQTVRWGWFLR